MNTFLYQGELYVRVVPGKKLFQSTMVHEVVNRGDVFALRVSDSCLTIIPGKATVEHLKHKFVPSEPVDVKFYRDKLRKLAADARAALGE